MTRQKQTPDSAGFLRSTLCVIFLLMGAPPAACLAATLSDVPVSVALASGRSNHQWTGSMFAKGECPHVVNFGKIIEDVALQTLKSNFNEVRLARTAEEEESAKASGMLLIIDISRVYPKWRYNESMRTEFDNTIEFSSSLVFAETRNLSSKFADTSLLGSGANNSTDCKTLREVAERDTVTQFTNMLKIALGSLLKDPALQTAIAEAEKYLGAQSRLLADLKPLEARYRVIEEDSAIRKRPDTKSPAVRKIGVGSILQIIGQLPGGWLQVAREGEAIGWIHEGSVTAISPPPGATPVAASRPPVGPSVTVSAVADPFPTKPVTVSFPRAKLNPDDIAVIIGNANYKATAKDIPDVVPAYADAEGMKRYAIQALGIKEENVIFIKDARLIDLISTFGAADDPRGKLFNWVKPGQSNVFVFYSGHGAPSADGTSSYLVPVDAQAGLINLSGYSVKTLYSNLGKLPAKSVTVVLEACFSGASQNGMLVKNASPIYQKAMAEIVPANLTVISAGSGNQIASWEQDKSHGLFTKHFLLGMAGAADKKPYGNVDGKVGTEELTAYLKGTMTYMAQRYYGREQTAQIAVGR